MDDGLAKRLREHREEMDLSQTELAERAGLHRQAIARYELSKQSPSWPTVKALALALNCTPNDFLTADELREMEKHADAS